MGWEKVERTTSKKLDLPSPHPLGEPLKPPKPKTPDKPSDPSKPPYPYQMTDSEARTYRWRWVEASVGDDEDVEELVRYVIEKIRDEGNDPAAYVGELDQEMQREAKQVRRAYRMATFKSAV